MQLVALDDQMHQVTYLQAKKGKKYFCPECHQILCYRRESQRSQGHFYHLKPKNKCHQHNKSLEHIQTQKYIYNALSRQTCFLERRFSKILRIADVVWEEQKLVFEIQCSHITADELLQRNRDYKKCGYEVIWIFHENYFGGVRCTAAEYWARKSNSYWTNMNSFGKGVVYDKECWVECGIKKGYSKKYPIEISKLFQISVPYSNEKEIPSWLLERLGQWKYAFRGDCIERYLLKRSLISMKHFKKEDKVRIKTKKKSWFSFLFDLYRFFLLRMLEKE